MDSYISASIAFIFSGRLRVMVATGPLTSNSTSNFSLLPRRRRSGQRSTCPRPPTLAGALQDPDAGAGTRPSTPLGRPAARILAPALMLPARRQGSWLPSNAFMSGRDNGRIVLHRRQAEICQAHWPSFAFGSHQGQGQVREVLRHAFRGERATR